MQAPSLYASLSSFLSLCNKSALSLSYRTLHLTPTHVRGCASFGIMEVECGLNIEKDIFVDAENFLQLLRSLPSADLEIKVKDHTLSWSCGAAKGQLAARSEAVQIPPLEFEVGPGYSPGPDFAKALELGSLACGSQAFLSIGLYGAMFSNDHERDMFSVCASDNTTISSARLCDALSGAPDQATLSPDAVKLLSIVAARKDAGFSVNETSFFVATPNTKLLLKQIAPLKHDIRKHINSFDKSDVVVELNRDVIASFIRRAEALSEEKTKTTVAISVKEGATRLSFAEGTSMSEEYYLVQDSPDVTIEPIVLETRRLARALANSTEIVFDYAAKKVLVFRGSNEFSFIVSGKSNI